jgi:hypothetical protein
MLEGVGKEWWLEHQPLSARPRGAQGARSVGRQGVPRGSCSCSIVRVSVEVSTWRAMGCCLLKGVGHFKKESLPPSPHGPAALKARGPWGHKVCLDAHARAQRPVTRQPRRRMLDGTYCGLWRSNTPGRTVSGAFARGGQSSRSVQREHPHPPSHPSGG